MGHNECSFAEWAMVGLCVSHVFVALCSRAHVILQLFMYSHALLDGASTRKEARGEAGGAVVALLMCPRRRVRDCAVADRRCVLGCAFCSLYGACISSVPMICSGPSILVLCSGSVCSTVCILLNVCAVLVSLVHRVRCV